MIVGIDLGTTGSLVGILRNGSPRLALGARPRKTLCEALDGIDSSFRL